MKNIIIMILITLSFSACSNVSLNINVGGQFSLNHNNKNIIIGNNIEENEFLNFKDLYVRQYTFLSKDGNKLFAESVETDDLFEFNFSKLYTIMYIFSDSKKYEKIYTRRNIQLVQVKLNNNTYVNVLAQGNNTQNYLFVYGFSNEEFLAIADEIKLKGEEISKPKFKAVVFNEESTSQTKWNDLLVFFTPLITPLQELKGI